MGRRNERFAPGADHLPAVVGVHDVVCQGAPESTRSWRRFVLPLCLAATAFLASPLARLANGLQWVRRSGFHGCQTPRFISRHWQGRQDSNPRPAVLETGCCLRYARVSKSPWAVRQDRWCLDRNYTRLFKGRIPSATVIGVGPVTVDILFATIWDTPRISTPTQESR